MSTLYSPIIHKFQNTYILHLNIQNFKPEDLIVSVTGRLVKIIGNKSGNEDEDDCEVVEFIGNYSFPEACNMELIKCTYSTNGILTIGAPESTEERVIEIEIMKDPEKMELN
ncbi:hypothetical protein M0802_006237 [Mischocyttarus mexicanus]|nr:hypothetical protein M0802_006237 [Mischocyttarus mexicanus]